MHLLLSGLRPYRAYRRYRNRRKDLRKLHDWLRNGRPVPPPHIVKQLAVREYADRFKLRNLVETGTYHGDMVEAVRDRFDRIVSVEVDATLHKEACRRFRSFSQITLLHGDSGSVLKDVVPRLDHPSLFWLDGHYSGAGTGKGLLNTPVERELRHIFLGSVIDHVILIDDARDFGGQADYPDLDRLREFVRHYRPDWTFEVRDDIIRMHPPI